MLWKIAHILGLRIVGRRRHDSVTSLLWLDDTTIPAHYAQPGMLNGRCLDISKTKVDEELTATFGYGLRVDPREHQGRAVRKSDANASHDGQEVICPAEPDQDSVYLRIVDNTDGDMVEDLRVAIVGNQIPLVYIKRRPLADRFSNTNTVARARRHR